MKVVIIRKYFEIKKISKPEETTLEQLGGEEKLAKLFSIISPNGKPFQPLHYYFLKMLFNGGIPFVQAFAKNPVVKENIVTYLFNIYTIRDKSSTGSKTGS